MADSLGTGRGSSLLGGSSPSLGPYTIEQEKDETPGDNGSTSTPPEGNSRGTHQVSLPDSNHPNQASNLSLHEQFAISRREFEFDEDEEVLEPASIIATQSEDMLINAEAEADDEINSDISDETLHRLLHVNEESLDYYTLLGLFREPPPNIAEIRSAYHRLSLAFHPDKQPHALKASAQKYFTRLQKAYETLIEPRKRVIYDLEGEEGVQMEYKTGGAMGQGGESERQLGVKTMGADDFKQWFIGVLQERERRHISELVGSSTTCKVVVNVEHLFGTPSRALRFRPIEDKSIETEEDIEVNGPLISAQDLQLRQSFSVPLPGLGKLLLSRLPSWKEIIHGDFLINNNENGEHVRSNWEEYVAPGIPKLTFSTGISGAISETLLVMIPKDGDEKGIPPTPFCLYKFQSDKINISTRFDHTFTDSRHQEGITSVTSLLNGLDLDVTAGVLPRRSLNIGLGRSVTLVEDTTPFYFHFRTLFNNSLYFKPPVLDFRISRSFAESRLGYFRWSSGDFEWPTLTFLSRLSPFSFARRPLFLPQGLLMSNMRIGYFWMQDKPQLIQTDDEDDINILDVHDRHVEKPMSSKVISDNPSLQLAVDSSPYDTTLTVTLGRDLFSTMSESPIRSRIRNSGEAAATTHQYEIPSSRGIRLEVESHLSLDLSLGGVVRGVRRIGDFTSIGIGIGLNPERGLYMSLSWSRLGQNLIIPVIILSGDEVDFTSVLWALTIPWVAYATVEFGILRPRMRRKRRKLVESARMELRANILKRKAEAEQANVLMQSLVEHRQAIEREQGGLVILRAEYGVKFLGSNGKTNWQPGEVANVTVALAALVDGSQLSLPRGLEKGSLIGFWDPSPFRRKLLVVDYLFGGKRHRVECAQNYALSLPASAHEVK